MRFLGNIIWLVLGGIIISLMFYIAGILLLVTIIGIPLATQCFKLGALTLWPFGSNVVTRFDKHPIANILWLIIIGWEMFLSMIGIGVFFCITIIGIPFGIQWFKMAVLALFPFGADIRYEN